MKRVSTSSVGTPARRVPGRLAWVGEAAPPRGAVLAEQVTRFDDSDDFLLAPEAFGFEFYVLHLRQRGVAGLDLVRLVRRRTAAGVVALDAGEPGAFAQALDLGADMVLPATACADDLAAGVASVHRRVLSTQAQASSQPWMLMASRAVLRAPDGAEIPLSASDVALLQCFAESPDGKVIRHVLVERLWGPQAGAMENALHATVYRLRKRIEQAGQALVPVHAVAKVGYEFRAPLLTA